MEMIGNRTPAAPTSPTSPAVLTLAMAMIAVLTLLAGCTSVPETPQDIPSSFWGDYARSPYTLEEFHERIVIGAESGAINLNYLGEYAASVHTIAAFAARWEEFFAADIPGEVGSYAGAAQPAADYRTRLLAFADTNHLYPEVFGNFAASTWTIDEFVQRHDAARAAGIASPFRGDYAQSTYTIEEYAARLAEIEG